MITHKLKIFLHLAIIVLSTVAVYANTLHAPFHFDDYGSIVKNPLIRNLDAFTDPSQALRYRQIEGIDLSKLFAPRIVTYFTFALNYRIHGLDVRGYHIFNISVHVINAALVYLLVILLLRTPLHATKELSARASEVAFATSLLFAVHPVQTQAVTYIVQRASSLSAMFYLACMTAYLMARMSAQGWLRWAMFGVSACSALLAMKSKETAYSIPLAIAAIEALLFSGRGFKRWAFSIAMALLVVVAFVHGHMIVGGEMKDIDAATRLQSAMPRAEYLLTELKVVVTYLRLIALPVAQNLDYDYQPAQGLADLKLLWAMLVLCVLVGLSIHGYRRHGLITPALGGAFFFIALSVESSIIPIVDVIFEHRVYLPSVGIIFAAVCLAFYLAPKRAVMAAMLVLAIALSVTAHMRNRVWASEIALWQDTATKSPLKARPHFNLADAYEEGGRYADALKEYEAAASLAPQDVRAQAGLAGMYYKLGRLDEAAAVLDRALSIEPRDAELWSNLGIIHQKRGRYAQSALVFERAASLGLRSPFVFYNLGETYVKLGNIDGALRAFDMALAIEPGYEPARRAVIALRARSMQ